MQSILDKIQNGELNTKQLLNELLEYDNKTVDEYDAACDLNDSNTAEITNLTTEAAAREANILTLKEKALEALGYAKSFESENILLKSECKEVKLLRNENKALKKLKAKHIESSKSLTVKNEALTKDCREYRKSIAVKNSDIARLRLTGFKEIGSTSFTIFPSKVSGGSTDDRKVVLLAHNNKGLFKTVTVEDGEVVQPKSHTFKFSKAQSDFILSFDALAKADNYNFTDRVLAAIN